MCTAGAAGAAVGAALTYYGASAALVGAATTATTYGDYALATAIGVDAVNTSVEVGTGTNYIAKGLYNAFGNEERTEEYFLNAYGEARDILYMTGGAFATFGTSAAQSGFSSQKSVGRTTTWGYSNFADGMSQEDAAVYANSIGGTIMEQTPGGQVFDNWRGLSGMYPEWDVGTNLAQKPIWDALPYQYANGAKGMATYVHLSGYEGKVWLNIEKPILEENDVIIQEVIVDAK